MIHFTVDPSLECVSTFFYAFHYYIHVFERIHYEILYAVSSCFSIHVFFFALSFDSFITTVVYFCKYVFVLKRYIYFNS